MGKPFGMELVLDLQRCDRTRFNRPDIAEYFEGLCDLIEMQRCELFFWDDELVPEAEQAPEHLRGHSAVQFILTSSVVIHTLDQSGNVYVNIFSCKEFDTRAAKEYTQVFFDADKVYSTTLTRH